MFSESVVHKKCPHSIYSINIFQLGKTGGKREFLCCIFGFVPLLLLDQSDHLMVPPYGTLVFPVFFFFFFFAIPTRDTEATDSVEYVYYRAVLLCRWDGSQ